jgi:hypothetical protein
MRPYIVPVVMLAGIAWLTSGPSAQGLGGVAKREAERRQQVSGGKKYTNEDLQAVSVTAPAPPAAPDATASTASPAGAAGASAPATEEAKDGAPAAAGETAPDPAMAGIKTAAEKRGEEYWRGKAGVVQALVDKANARVDGLKKRLESLEAQLSKGAGTSHVQEREVTLKALDKAQNDVKSMRDEWNRLEARAQAAKVPPEWLR